MIHRIVQFALRQRFLILMLTVFIAVGGAVSFERMPVDAYPDLSPPMVEIITQWPGHAAEEVERLVTLPTEIEMNGVPKMSVQRSISLYGLSDVILTFEEDTDNYFARQIVFQRLSEVTYPSGVTPTLAPLSSPSGLVYRYVIESPDRSPQELKTYEDWVIEREYKQVPGVADDSGFGGTVMQYQVLLDPARLYGYHISVPQVIQQLSVNNSNTGGGFYSQGGQFYYVRGLGLLRDTADIGDVVVGSQNGVPVRVRDIGDVTIGHAPRLGEFGFNKTDDAVEGVILMLTGEQTQNVLKGVEAKTKQLNESILPPDIKIRPYYDRSDLVRLTTGTVEGNLIRGMVLVLIVLIFFLVSFRAAVIVALTIPLALLMSFIVLHARGVAANLLSIGAIDFGIIIDGTLVMVENIFRELGLREGQQYELHEVILAAARDVDRPIFYSVAVIIAGYIPIYALSGPSGKLFHPMADTMSIALVGALILTLTFVPVMCSYWFRKGVHESVNRPYEWIRRKYAAQLDRCLDHPKATIAVALTIFGAALLLIPFIGGEFMPHLDEGALWVRATMPYTISYEEAAKFSPQVRNILLKYPMVTDVGSELGRPDDGTDPTGFFNDEFYVGLKPYDDATWKKGPIHDKAELTEDLQKKLDAFPGVIFNFTQPAEDAVDEALTGLKSSLAVKIYGPDLNVLQDRALEIKRRLAQVPGFTELTVVRELGQPSLLIDTDRDKIARYGINVADVEAVVQAAVGGQAATQVIQGEKLFDLVVRMKPEFRENAQAIGNLLVATPSGQQIPLSQLASIREASGASFIYREDNSRYIGVQYSIEGRDLESAVNEGKRAIADIQRSLPAGYRLTWGGEYTEYLAARAQMAVIGPLALLLIFMILFALYGNFKFPMAIALGVVITEPVGALIALKLTGTPFSVSSVLGLLALMGVSVETAVILVSFINKLRQEGRDIRTATREAALLRLRPIMMTALVACLGLLPAALSTGIGSDTQKPFAIVIVAGLISRLCIAIFVDPVLYQAVAREDDVLQV
ncbi:MAG TPA: CusA/CzcA family heavy metal efflux RND transporter [Candidatus Acidoferrales bacterium]|jgi:cobalt-zinc-cadmium resistance protein CzcA|nr:CusA/CzcA family heavy metal efflux RND transporter [Candidatus Acidoferrales bacterium]